MESFNPTWITNKEFCDLKPENVFHKACVGSDYKPDESLSNKHILFRKKFSANKGGKFVIRITADDYYKLYINGRFVTQGPAPAYYFNYYYNTVDVTDFITDGENTVAVHTYYQGLINRVWVSGDRRHGLALDLKNDENTVIATDESWKCHEHTGFSALGKFGYDTAFAECYDAGCAETGFEKCDFDDSYWENACINKYANYTLFPQPTKQLDIYDVKPQTVTKTADGYIFDFGFEAVGYLKFSATGKKGDCIDIYCGEELNNDGSVRWKMRCNCDYAEKFILSGNKDDILNQYDYKAFRYAQIKIPDGVEFSPETVRFTVRHYPYVQKKVFASDSDSKLRSIAKLCADTLKYGVQECFMDCPSREKGQYLGDVTISGLAHLHLTGDPSMILKAFDNYAQSSFVCKGLLAVSPCAYMQEIADYSLQFPMQVLEVYKYTKDKSVLEKYYPYVMNVLEYFGKYRRENGLIDRVDEKWNLVDWPANLRDNYDFPLKDPQDEPGFQNVINAFYCGMISDIDEIRAILGIEPTGLKESTYKAFVKAFYDPEQKLFVDSIGSKHPSLHSNILPLLYSIGINEENKDVIINHIVSKKLTSAGTYMSFFALYALKKAGRYDLALELIKDSGAWLNMISEGATTCYEAWGKDQKWNTSLFHPWSACPAIILD